MSDQLGFVDAFAGPGMGSNPKLERIDALIDWQAVGRIVAQLRTAPTGRRPYDPLAMLKALYLAALYDLSDPGLEEALLDRLSFRRFCGFAWDAATPDETTICRFRAAISASGGDGTEPGKPGRPSLMQDCFDEINRQLDRRGIIVRKGTLLDASIIPATHNPPSREAGMGAAHPREPGADWTNKNGKSYFGYKLHIGVDEGSGIVRRAVFTPARTSDSETAEDLICGDEAAVYADKAYENKHRRARLKAKGIKDRIMHRRHKHIAELPPWQQVRNALISRRRAPVEATFSALKRLYGLARTRCHSLARNQTAALAALTVYNLRRTTLTT